MKQALILAAMSLIAASTPDDFARAVDALWAGSRAHGRPMARRAAGRRLLATGAHPLDGEDLAKSWAAATDLPYRDRALGPAYRTVTVPGGATAHFEQVFLAGQRAQVAIIPLSRAPFALSVKDDQGAASCAATAGGRCAWVALWTTRYTINVSNPGHAIGRYYMLVQ